MPLARMGANTMVGGDPGDRPVSPFGALKGFTSFVLIRIGFGALLASGIMLGGVHLIVTSSIDTMNSRISDLSTHIGESIKQLDTNFGERINSAMIELRGEFRSTRELMTRATKDGPYGMSSWRVGGVEFFYPRQGVGVSLQDFLQRTNFSFAAAEFEKQKGNIFEEVRFIAVPPNDLFVDFKARGFRIEEAFLSIAANADRVKSVTSRFANCVSLSNIGVNKYYIDVIKNNAIVIDDAIVCPTLRFAR